MNVRQKLTLASLIVPLAVLALTSNVAAQATSTTTSTTAPFEGAAGGGGSCVGELFTVSGHLHVVVHTTQNSQFTSRIFHVNIQGSGTGQTSGMTYTFNESRTEMFNTHDAGALEFRVTDTVHMIAQGEPNNDFLLRQVLVVAVSANGETTPRVDNLERVCN